MQRDEMAFSRLPREMHSALTRGQRIRFAITNQAKSDKAVDVEWGKMCGRIPALLHRGIRVFA
jgi:hypothetical protein